MASPPAEVQILNFNCKHPNNHYYSFTHSYRKVISYLRNECKNLVFDQCFLCPHFIFTPSRRCQPSSVALQYKTIGYTTASPQNSLFLQTVLLPTIAIQPLLEPSQLSFQRNAKALPRHGYLNPIPKIALTAAWHKMRPPEHKFMTSWRIPSHIFSIFKWSYPKWSSWRRASLWQNKATK